ncbi:MAG: PDGLE domain-containing protein [Rubrobacteraceae bacterium]
MSRSENRYGNRSVLPFVLVGLAVALLIGMVISNFAASSPDALQRAVINSQCEGAADEEACLAAQEGEPLFRVQPASLFDYSVAWLSGLLGVAATFGIGAGLVLLLRRFSGSSEASGAGRRVR